MAKPQSWKTITLNFLYYKQPISTISVLGQVSKNVAYFLFFIAKKIKIFTCLVVGHQINYRNNSKANITKQASKKDETIKHKSKRAIHENHLGTGVTFQSSGHSSKTI